jgi:hypothetical protein
MDLFLEEDDTCELCGCKPEELYECEGILCCEPCCRLHAGKLADYSDDLQDDIRGS